MEARAPLSAHEVEAAVRDAVARTPVVDVHTHLLPPGRPGCLAGIDALLTYHYLTSEYLAQGTHDPQAFFDQPQAAQAEAIWRALFVEASPLSEAARGIATTLEAFGLAPSPRELRASDLTTLRSALPAAASREHAERVFALAGVARVVMTNDPFDDADGSGPKLFADPEWDRTRFASSLRLDRVFGSHGTAIDVAPGELVPALERARAAMTPAYVALSLGSEELAALAHDLRFERELLPWLAAEGLPLALMLGVERGVNPALRDGGDAPGAGDLTPLVGLLQRHPRTVVLATALAEEAQHRLVALARVFPNLRLFGAWWYMNHPGLVRALTDLRLEALGPGFVPQHSDARVLEQLVYKWRHFRALLADCLVDHFERLRHARWPLGRPAIERDVARLLHGNAEAWLGRSAR